MTDIWKTIESRLSEIYSLPHNKVFLADKGRTLDSTIQHKLKEVRSGINGVPKQETFRGPKTFLRVVGANNQVYSGEWWFDAGIYKILITAIPEYSFLNRIFEPLLSACFERYWPSPKSGTTWMKYGRLICQGDRSSLAFRVLAIRKNCLPTNPCRRRATECSSVAYANCIFRLKILSGLPRCEI